MPLTPSARQLGLVTLFSAGYFACVLAGHALSFPDLDLPMFWPAAGMVVAALALTHKAHWWLYLLSTSLVLFLAELLIYRQTWGLSLVFAGAMGLEGLVGGLLLQRWAGGLFRFATLRDVVALAALSLVAPLVGAAIGAAGWISQAPPASFWTVFQLWWQADNIGILVVAPVQIAGMVRYLRLEPRPLFTSWGRVAEAITIFLGLNVATWLAFGPFAASPVESLTGVLYLILALAWAGLRFCRFVASIASCNTILIVLAHTTRGEGLFVLTSTQPTMQGTLLQAFALTAMLTPLLFATVMDEQRFTEDKLRSNLTILQSVLDNATDLIYVKDLAGRYLLVNPAFAKAVQLPLEQIIGRRDVEVVLPGTIDLVRQREQLVLAAGHALTFEDTIVVDGCTMTYLTTKCPYRDSHGEVIGLVGLSRDITQRIREVEALAASERRYRTLVDLSNIGIYETDASGATLFVNPRWSELTGRDMEVGIGDGWVQCLHPDDREPVVKAFRQALEIGGNFAMEYRYVTPAGSIIWVYGTALPIRNEDGEVTGYLGNVIDISDQKRAALELQASEARFRRLADSAPVLIWSSAPGACNNYCNRKWLEFTGRTQEQESGHGWLEGVHPEDRERCIQAYAEAEAAHDSFHIDFRLRRYDGEYRWMHHDGVPKVSVSGEFSGFIGSCFDVTDQRRATETLLRAKVELEHHVAERTAELQEANQRLQELLVARARAEERLQQQQNDLAHVSRLSVMGEIAAGLAHELNQPLFAIQNYTAGILRRWPEPAGCSPELREIVQQIARESTRAAVIIRRVLEFSRKQIDDRVLLPLNQVVDEVLQLLGSDLRRKSVDLRLSLAEDLPHVVVDRVQIQQVLVNLIRNALEAMEALPIPERRLSITTYAEGGNVHCLVHDSGPGIQPDVRQRLFEPFFTTKPEGLGMGLSISRSIVEAHGGQLLVEGPAGSVTGGATLHFQIPLAEDAVDDHRADDADSIPGR